MSAFDDLNEKQKRFVEAYLGDAGLNATEAARQAGYSPHSAGVQGCALLKNPKVKAAIAAGRKPREKAAIISRERREELLSEFANDTRAQKKDRIKAIEVLGKMNGDFTEKREVEVTGAQVTLYIPDNGRGKPA